MEVKPGRRQQEHSEATRRALLDVAREEFTEYGYDGASIEQITKRARVTRGALYHHFPEGKKELFRTVFEELEMEIVSKVAGAAPPGGDVWDMVLIGVRAFLDACMEPAVQRVALLDAPSVLGWETWRAIDEQYGYGIVRASIEASIAAGVIDAQPIDALGHMFLGALNEAALLIARASDPAKARADVEQTLIRLLEGLRRT
jgi:AcrR family transcriptional regulator